MFLSAQNATATHQKRALYHLDQNANARSKAHILWAISAGLLATVSQAHSSLARDRSEFALVES